jgi:hypothetical protein
MIYKVKDEKWMDHKGQKVPREYVSRLDKDKEKAIASIIAKAEKIEDSLRAFKVLAFDLGDDIYNQMLEDANIEPGERKGYYTLYSFDKSFKVEVSVSDRIEFDERINFAQIKLNEFIEEKTNGADVELRELISNAFTTTRGRLDTKRVLSLFTYKITHPKWVEAMELIKKSISTNNSVRYMQVYRRDEDGNYSQVNLNFSSIKV